MPTIMLGHVNEDLEARQWPSRCLHPLRDVSLEDDTALIFHLTKTTDSVVPARVKPPLGITKESTDKDRPLTPATRTPK
jgi:hypothetical protein